MKLPNGDRAYIGDKLQTYSLCPDHKDGKHKARVFASALGITLDNAAVLAEAVLHAAATSERALDTGRNPFGAKYSLEFEMRTEKGVARIQTGWIVLDEEDFPRLVTCFII